MKIKYIIEQTMNHELEDFEVSNEEDLLQKIREYIKEDPAFIIEGLDDNMVIKVEKCPKP